MGTVLLFLLHGGNFTIRLLFISIYSLLMNEASDDLHVNRQGTDGSFFILTHKATIPFSIRTEDAVSFLLNFSGVMESPPQGFKGERRGNCFAAPCFWIGSRVSTGRKIPPRFRCEIFRKLLFIRNSRNLGVISGYLEAEK